MPGEHAEFSPSSSARWLACPLTLAGPQAEDTEGEPAAQGTAMHDHAEKALRSGTPTEQLASDVAKGCSVTYEFGRKKALEGHEWGPHVIPYVDGVRKLAEQLGRQAVAMYERRVTITPECWGTADTVVVTACRSSHARLDVADLKTGRHVVPPDAPQFLTYAVGCCEEWGWEWPEGVYLHRWQRYADDPHSTCRVGVADLKRHKARIQDAIRVARSGGTPTAANINPECGYCLRLWGNGAVGKAGCPAHTQRALDLLARHDIEPDRKTGKLVKPDPADLRIDQLSALLPVAQEIIDWLQAVLAYGNEQAAEGREFLGMKTVLSSPRRSWTKGMTEQEIAAQVRAVAAMLERDVDPFVQKLAPLTKIEALLGKKSIDHLTQKSAPTRRLVPDTDADTRADVGSRLSLLTEESLNA